MLNNTGGIPEILALCDLLSEIGDQCNLRALELKMYGAERMSLLYEHARGSLPWNISRRMAHHPLKAIA